jgi:hypothetical protein
MNRPMTHDAGCFVDQRLASIMTPAGVEQFKLDRLLELRAVIDSVRREREHELLFDVQAEAIRHS